MLERLYNLILFFKEYAVLTGFVVLSFVLIAMNDNAQVKRVRTIATVGLGVLQHQLSFIPRYFRLAEENEILRRMNLQLADEVSRLREAKVQNLRLRQSMGFQEASSFPVLAANVVSKNLTMLRNTLTLDIGTAAGVAETMPVVSPEGLVGIVVATSENYAIVNILLNTEFRVSQEPAKLGRWHCFLQRQGCLSQERRHIPRCAGRRPVHHVKLQQHVSRGHSHRRSPICRNLPRVDAQANQAYAGG